jgi:hypothetical protein
MSHIVVFVFGWFMVRWTGFGCGWNWVGLGLAVYRVRQGCVWDQVRFGLVMFGV